MVKSKLTCAEPRKRSKSPNPSKSSSKLERKRSPVRPPPSKKEKAEVVEETEDEDPEAALKQLMGFGAFRSTKNTKVPGNDRNYAVHKAKKAEYRQYMNRKGGFNRPLSPSRK
jgi:U4/U6.U5 tri-snRNP-associated protein 3